MTVVERFRRWRAWRGWSQSEAAHELGVSQALMSQIERGDAVVTKVGLAARIEKATTDWPEGPILMKEWVRDDEEHAATVETAAELPECA